MARPEAVDYNDDNFQGTIKGLYDVLVLPINEKYTEEHIEFLASSIREAVEKSKK
jgi:perosamine synthetase